MQEIAAEKESITQRPFLPNHRIVPAERSGLLSGIGPIDIGFGIAVPTVRGNDPVSVGTRVNIFSAVFF